MGDRKLPQRTQIRFNRRIEAEGKHQEALGALWRKYRLGWRRLLSKRMLAELSLRASFDLDTLSDWRISNRIPAGTVPDCERCDDICCAGVENAVSLRLRDIAKLMDVGRTDLISRKKPNFPSSMLGERPVLRELVSSMLWRTLPVLKQHGENRVCAALNSELKCSLHPHWPTSCERFPYTLSVVRREVVWGRRCPSRQQSKAHVARGREIFKASVAAYNERIKDAVLLTHARGELDEIGLGRWLVEENEDPFEPRGALEIVQ